MNVLKRAVSALPCVALVLAVASSAHATTYAVSGQVWEGGSTSGVPSAGDPLYSTTPSSVFTVTNTSPSSLFSFNSNNGAGDYTLSGFLTSGGDGLAYVTGSSHAGDSINNDVFLFQGTTSLADGTYSFEHDDGMLLYLNGVLVVNEGGPTSAVTTTLCVGTTGCDYNIGSTGGSSESFSLYYAEVFGPPAVLETNLPLTGPVPHTVTPEPSSLLLLGTGLLSAAGMLRRKLRA